VITIPLNLTGIDFVDPFSNLNIYPNPSSGLFNIEMDNAIMGELLIDIFTETGSKILNIKFEKETPHFLVQVDLSAQQAGIYIINLMLDTYRAERTLVVE
jgi:hypothetical protein